jgi:hypothetical protein
LQEERAAEQLEIDMKKASLAEEKVDHIHPKP